MYKNSSADPVSIQSAAAGQSQQTTRSVRQHEDLPGSDSVFSGEFQSFTDRDILTWIDVTTLSIPATTTRIVSDDLSVSSDQTLTKMTLDDGRF